MALSLGIRFAGCYDLEKEQRLNSILEFPSGHTFPNKVKKKSKLL